LAPEALWKDANFDFTFGGLHPQNFMNSGSYSKCIFPYEKNMDISMGKTFTKADANGIPEKEDGETDI
jgi:hypothetical protein